MTPDWHDTINRLLAENTKNRDHSAAVAAFGHAPTIVVVGPTGSGKSSLVNLLMGCRLLPEGLDHTTPLPTIISYGDQPRIVPLGPNGTAVSDMGEPFLGKVELPNLPSSKSELLDRRLRSDWENLKDFWADAVDSIKAGKCVAVSVSLPLPWLPPGIRIVDVPGFEGWYPEEQSELHELVLMWLDLADHTIFVAGLDKIKIGDGIEFLRRQSSKGRSASLVVTKVDQNHQEREAMVSHVADYLEGKGLSDSQIQRSFMCASIRWAKHIPDTKDSDIVLDSILNWMVKFQIRLTTLRQEHVSTQLNARREHRERQQADLALKLDQLEANCRQGIEAAFGRLHGNFVTSANLNSLREKLGSFIHEMDDEILFTPWKFQKEARKLVKKPLAKFSRKALSEFDREVRSVFETQISELERVFPSLGPSFGGTRDNPKNWMSSDVPHDLGSDLESFFKGIWTGALSFVTFGLIQHEDPRVKVHEKLLAKFDRQYLEERFELLASKVGAELGQLDEEGRRLKHETMLSYWRSCYPARGGLKFVESTSTLYWLDVDGCLWQRSFPHTEAEAKNLTECFGLPLAGGGMHANPDGELLYVTETGQLVLLDEPCTRPTWLSLTEAAGWVPKACGQPWIGTDCFFRGTDGHVHRLHRDRGRWDHEDLTARFDAPLVADDLEGVTDEKGDHVLYVGTDSHIHEFYRDTEFRHTDLTSFVDLSLTKEDRAPLAGGRLTRCKFPSPQILFRDTSGLVREMIFGGCGHWCLQPEGDQPVRSSRLGGPLAIVEHLDGERRQHVFLCDQDGRMRAISTGQDVSLEVGGLISIGEPHVAITAAGPTVFLRDDAGHIHAAVRADGREWRSELLW